MEEAENRPQKCIKVTARLIKEFKPLCQGVHLMPIGWEKRVPSILDAAGV